MYKIADKKILNAEVQRFTVEAPDIARARKAGQIVILRLDESGERIPFTIVSSDLTRGTIDIISQVVGKTTYFLSRLNPGDSILDVIGPLGKPTQVEYFGNVAGIGGGVGIAPLLPITTALKEHGNRITSILGARNKQLLILEDDMRKVSNELIVATDDGSYGTKGLVTHRLKEIIDTGKKIDLVIAVGPVIMMKAVAELTLPYRIKTMVSLNPIMVDGTGMCGACRCIVDGKTRYACTEGPEFDGHQVDYDSLMLRQRMFKKHEKLAYERCKHK
ncbi:MAG: sulfide/dihydroorotate dehydrogenase-like FAD/NAD-binding protein [bacterium]